MWQMVRTEASSVGSLPPGLLIGGTSSVDDEPFAVSMTAVGIKSRFWNNTTITKTKKNRFTKLLLTYFDSY